MNQRASEEPPVITPRNAAWKLSALALALGAFVGCAPVDESTDLLGETDDALTIPVLSNCNESTIRANAPPDARVFLDRAYTWIHRGVPYCQCVVSGSSPYRSDCSGFISMIWGLGGPGHTTYSFAGGPWADRSSIRLSSRNQLRVGDALNYPGSVSAGSGHIVLFGGWLNRAHTSFCSLEESHTGTPARVIVRSVDPVYLPIRLASRNVGPLCSTRCEGNVLIDPDCDRHDCHSNGGRCVSDGHTARCVDRGCPTWGTDSVCLDSRTVISCVNGDRRSATRCTGANPRCLPQGTGVRCESPECPRTGNHQICLNNHTIAACSTGRVGTGRDCPMGTFCSETGPGDAHCVSRACVRDETEDPMAHQACLAGGSVLRCDANGGASTAHCPAGQSCSNVDGHRCVAIACPAVSGSRVAVCSPSNERVVCQNGVVIERAVCNGTCVANDGTPARCVASQCTVRGADGRVTLPPAHAFCTSPTAVGRCDDEGQYNVENCDSPYRCLAAGSNAACVSTPSVDAGTPPPPPDAGAVTSDAGAFTSDAVVRTDVGVESDSSFEDDASLPDDVKLIKDDVTDPSTDPVEPKDPYDPSDPSDPAAPTGYDAPAACSTSLPARSSHGACFALGLAALVAARRRRH